MNDGFSWWLIVLGIAVGVGLVWVFSVRLPRAEADVDQAELAAESGWISRNIETYGGIAPQPLVEEILELHRQYLATGASALTADFRPEPALTAAPPEPAPAVTPTQAAAPTQAAEDPPVLGSR